MLFDGRHGYRKSARISLQLPALKAQAQQTTLSEKAKAIMNGWSFAFAGSVRKLVDAIAAECFEISMTPNARLGDGANAIGIPEFEMSAMLENEEDVAVVLKHALANGAISVQRDYGQGGKDWCLIELSELPRVFRRAIG